jgi:hypothetical protein
MTRKQLEQLKTLMNTIDGNIRASHAYRDIMTWIDEQENEDIEMVCPRKRGNGSHIIKTRLHPRPNIRYLQWSNLMNYINYMYTTPTHERKYHYWRGFTACALLTTIILTLTTIILTVEYLVTI